MAKFFQPFIAGHAHYGMLTRTFLRGFFAFVFRGLQTFLLGEKNLLDRKPNVRVLSQVFRARKTQSALPAQEKSEVAPNKAFRARYDGTCKRCGKPIDGYLNHPENAHWINLFNLPKPKSAFHVDCENPTVSPYTNPQDVPNVQDEDKDEAPESITPVTPVPTNGNGNGNGHASSVEKAIRELIERTQGPKQELDADKVTEIVRAEIAKVTFPTVVEVRQEGKEPKKLDCVHKQFPKLLKIATMGRKNTYLYGATQGGKSTAAKQVAEALELDYYSISLNIQSQPSLLTGYNNANGEYVATDFYRWFTEGGVFHAEEYDNASGNLQTTLNEALANGAFAFPCGRKPRHPKAIFFGSGNTTGLGANRTYTSRQVMDEASRTRFAFLKWEYDSSLELGVAKAKNPRHGEIWCTWVQAVRAYLATINIERPVASPQASIDGAEFLNVFSAEEVADMVFFKGCEKDLQSKVLAAVPLPRVGA